MKVALVAVVSLLLIAPVAAGASDDAELHHYAERTWASFDAMTDPGSGLPADVLESDGTRSV